MVRFIIEIEQVAEERLAHPSLKTVNVVFRTEKQQPTLVEEAAANRLAPHLRALPSTSFSDPAAGE
jgi:hypothetical protein